MKMDSVQTTVISFVMEKIETKMYSGYSELDHHKREWKSLTELS